MANSCAIIGCSPLCFPWGFDEEYESCAALKLLLLSRITKLRSDGCLHFHVSMDCGTGLYAAEAINRLQASDKEIALVCYVPYEEQATKWTPDLRDRYFNALSKCKKVETIAFQKEVGCEFKAHLAAMLKADNVIALFSPDNPLCEREISVITVAETLGKRVLLIDPEKTRFY